MIDSVERPPAPPRSPYVAAVFCAACVGAAAWTWMRYSYGWENPVFPDALHEGQWPDDAYVRMRVKVSNWPRDHLFWYLRGDEGEHVYQGRIMGAELDCAVLVRLDDEPRFVVPDTGTLSVPTSGILMAALTCWTAPMKIVCRLDVRDTGWVGVGPPRDEKRGPLLCILLDTRASRFTGASVAGLAVGGMGILVFAVTLRHWLRERRRSAESPEP